MRCILIKTTGITSLRNRCAMQWYNRFAVTTDIKPDDKRDKEKQAVDKDRAAPGLYKRSLAGICIYTKGGQQL